MPQPTPRTTRTTRLSLACSLLVACVVAGPLVGCTYSPYEGKEDRLDIEAYPRIVASRYTHRKLLFSPPTVDPGTDAQPMRVTVPVRSKFRRSDLRVQYRFEWLDDAGRPLSRNAQPEWRYKALPPRNQVFLDGNSMDLGAKDWRLEVRLAD